MSQNNSSQQFGVGNMQMWQQHLVYKQLQELQRQQQLQQLDQGSRQQSLQTHSSISAKPVGANQFPLVMNEMPVNGGSNFMWGNNFAGGMPTISNNTHLVNAGNMDWTQSSGSPAMGTVAMHNVSNGLMMSNEQSQLTRLMSYAPQQTDQSFYGMPVSSSRLYGNQYSQFLGTSEDSTDLMTGRAVNHAEKASEPFNSFQFNQNFPSEGPLQDRNAVNSLNFQGKSFYGRAPMEMLNGDSISGNFQQVNSNVQMHIPDQNAQNGQNFYSQEEQTVQDGTSSSVAMLDPTEHKLLFGSDEDDNWGASFSSSLGMGTGDYQHDPSLENGSSGRFPSLQSGSWSALMQEAVQVTSSEKGLQEEWSGLSLQNMNQSMLKNSVAPETSGRQLAAWGDDNHKPSATSLASRSLTLFNNAERSLGSSNATLFQYSFISAGDKDKNIQNEDPNMSFRLSSGEDRNKQFSQVQKHKQPSEGDLQVQTGAPNGTWAVSYQQQGSIPTDMPNLQGGWSHQQNMPLSSVPKNSSNFYDNSGNIWGIGQNVGNLNSEVHSLKPNAGSPEMKNEDPVIGNFGPRVSSNTMRLNQPTKQHTEDSHQVVHGTNFPLSSSMNDKDANTVRMKNLTNQMPEKLDRSFTDNEKGLATQKKNENLNDISVEGRASNSSSDGHNTNLANVANDSSISTFYNQNIFVRGNQKSGNETDQITMAPKLVQNPFANIGSHSQHSFPINHQQNIPGFSNSRNEEQRHVEKSNSTGHVVQNATLLKGVGMDVVEQNSNSVNASGSFTGSATQYFQNSKNAYSSQNMLELLHKVDQSKKFVAGAASDATGQASTETESSHPNQSTVMQGYGLQLAPPAQWQPHSKYSFPRVINDTNNRQLDKEICSKDQAGSDCAPSVMPYNHEACHRDNSDSNSNLSKQKHKAIQDLAVQYDSSPTMFSKIPHVGNQLEDMKLKHHDTGTRNQVEPQQHQQVNHNSHSPGLEALNSTGPACASVHAVDGGCIKQQIPSISHHKISVQQFPVAGARSGLQPSLSGMSQQPGSSKMLHSVWAKLSAQQRLAGIQAQKLTPQLLQSIINSGKGASIIKGLQKEVDQANKGENVSSETGRSSVNLQNEIQGESSTVSHFEKVAAASKMGNISHWQEPDHKAEFDRASDASLSSLVHLHQQDADKSKRSEDPSVSTQQMLAPTTANAASSSSHLGVSQRMLTSSSQQQNYSLLHQMQAMKDGDSDTSKLLGKRPRSADLGCSATQDWNTRKGFVYGWNALSRVPSDGKDGVAPHSQSELSMVSFAPKDEEENVNAAARRHADLPNQNHSLTPSSSNFIRGTEHPQISHQMAPSWFEKYGNDKNGLLVASRGQKITNFAAQPYFHSKISGSREDSVIVEQRSESFQEGTTRHSSLVPTVSANESSHCSALPSGSDHGVVLRPKKRKTATSDLLSWQKVVTASPRSFQSISMPEQEWAQAANWLMEQMDDEGESVYDSPSTLQPQKRLILTTKLMQRLLPAASYRMLKVDAADSYESLAFCVAKSALADACSLIHSTDSSVCLDQNNTIPKELKSFARMEESVLLKVMDNFIGRSKKLEDDLLRLDKRTSLLDVRLECQEIERFSIVNRLGKFHGRPHSEGAEASTSEARKALPQRYVSVIPVPGSLPEGVPCFSL